MKRKYLSGVLALTLMVTSLVGCGKSEGSLPGEGGEATGGKVAEAKLEEVNILYPGDESDRMTEFLNNEFAEKMEEDLGIKLKVTFVPWDQYWEQKDIMLAAKEPVDLYWDGLPDLSTMVNKKQTMPLDDLIAEYGQDMLKVLPKEQIQGGMIDGVTYGIPSAYAPSSNMFQLVCVREDLLKDVGMTTLETPEDLMEYSKKVKEKYPEIQGGGDPLIKPLTRYYTDEQYNWVAAQDLVVFGEETHKAYSYYETEAFQELSKFNRQMSLDGQYTDDVTIKYNERSTRMHTGIYIWVEGSLGKENEMIDAVRQNVPDAELKSYLLAPEKPDYIVAAGGEVMCIPQSAPNPEGAMKFLNWLYTSQENYNMALYGVEGVDYEIQDDRIVKLQGDEFFYEWMFRNQHYQMFAPDVDEEFIEMYKNWDNDAKRSAAFGFAFDNSNVKEIENQLKEIEGRDISAIRSGFIDFETAYPKAIQDLKDAGIDEYVAEVQRQLDEFLANK